ncbi:MAG: MATE family efflux transporter [Desulfovibrionaceae bacterium]|nr:MATE family efflux transporter [Desulfovibrionaceae bacterium]
MVMMYSVVLTGLTAVWTAGQINADTQGALGMVNQCGFFLMVVIMAISSGATAAVSQSLGAGKLLRAKRYLRITVLGSLTLGILLAILGFGRGAPILRLLQLPEEVIPLASAMWDLSMLALPAQHLYAATGVMFRAIRIVLPPLWIALFINILNPLLCLGLGLGYFGLPLLGYKGLIIANIVAQSIGALLNCLLLIKSSYLDKIRLPRKRWLKHGLPYLLKVALPAGLASFVWQTGYLMLFVLVASVPTKGVAALAGLTAGLRIESLLFLPGMAVNSSIAVLVGNALGARDEEKARRLALNITFLTTVALSLVALAIWPFRANIAQAFSQDISTQEHIISYLTYNLISTPFSIASTVMGGVMVGAGATQFNLAVYGGCSWFIRLPLGYILGHKVMQTAEGIFCAMLISQTIQATLMILVIKYCNWTKYTLRKTSLKNNSNN